MSPADQVLFDQWITRRDASAFTCLAEKYAAMVYAVGRRITGNTHDAEDVAQAAFEALASQRRAPRVHLGAWLHRVATYRALNHLKAENRRTDREARYDRERPKHTEIGWDDIYELVDEAIAALPDKQRDVVVAHYLEGKTHDAIARELGVSRPAVTQRVQAGVAGIRAALGKHGVAVPLAALGAMLVNGAEAAAPIALAAQLGKIGLSGYVGKTSTGIGLWQGIVAGLGTAKGLAAGVVVVVAISAGVAGLAQIDRGAEEVRTGNDSPAQANSFNVPVAMETDGSPPDSAAVAPVESAASAATITAGSQGARLYGKVVDTKGIPVDGANVNLSGSTDPFGGIGRVSEEDGSFEFLNVLPAKSCWIGSHMTQDGKRLGGGQVELNPVLQGESYEVLLTLYDGVIAGRVLDEHAKPLSGIEVVASPHEWHYRFSLPSSETGEDGRYQILGVMSGEYEMTLKSPDGPYLKTGVVVRSDGIGVRSEVNLVFKPTVGSVLSGRVTDAYGKPIARAYVQANLTIAPHTSSWDFTDAEGYYEIMGLIEGPNLASAQHFDYGGQTMRNVPLDGDPVDFVLPFKGTVNGQVINAETDEAIPGFEIHNWEPVDSENSHMVRERWKPNADPDGQFSVVLAPGEQTLRIRAAGFSESSQSVQVPAGETLSDVRVTLKPSQALRGLVTDAATGAPVPGALIFRGPLPIEVLQSSKTAAHTDDAGVFIMEDASPDGELLSVTHPSYAAAWAQVGAGESEITIPMSAGVEITGTVHLNDAPVEGIPVHATAPNRADSALAQATTDAEGRFTLKGLPEKGMVLYAKLGAPHAPQERTMYFQPDEAWRAGRDPVHFDFVQSRAELSVTMVKGSDPQPGIMVYASQDLGGGYMDSVSVFTGQDGSALFQDLTEGRWDLQIFTPGAKGPDDARRMTPVLTAYQMIVLQLDLDQPYTESINIVNYPNPDTAPQDAPEKPVDGEQVMVPLVLESGGEREWPSPGPS